MICNTHDLNEKVCACTEAFSAKIDGSNGKRAVVLCGGTGCLSSNSAEIRHRFEQLVVERGLSEKVTVNQVGCFGFCSQGPFVKIYPEDTLYRLVKLEDVEEIVDTDLIGGEVVERLLFVDPATKEKIAKQDEINFYKKQRRVALHGCGEINPENIDEALGFGAFRGLERALSMPQQAVIDEVLAAGLRGRGGGGFPTGRKWQFAYNQQNDEKYVVCNGDEGDPGAFMDRSILEGNPLAVIEGMMIAGYAIGAKNGYFYVRAEYPVAVNRLRIAIKQAEALGLLGDRILGTDFSFRVHIRLGAGAFVCGEETALLNSIEGQRGMPRPRPPFPAVKGLWQKPTIVNNVETLACVPYILREGAAKFAEVGTERSKGTKVFALGGKINNVGLVEIPMGTTLRELIYDIGGGIPNGKKFKAIQTGGPSGGCLTAEYLDEPIDFDNLVAKGSMMGSGGAIVMDEDNCMVDVAKFYMEFICDESCGKCTPCRIGTKRMLEILTRITEGKGTMQDLDELDELAKTVKANSLCALGQTSANPVVSTLTHFRDEYLAHIQDKTCPAHVCKKLMQYSIEKDKCFGCGLCARTCPVGAIVRTDYVAPGKKLAAMEIDAGKCIKCGACMASCKFKAIDKK
ncbi:MAG: NADH-quinone oxidoreductase subunit NuoF [Candidatus Faecousia sp.]|uniref:NADH-quinone oxidoreductase subunit NuoF n=1 Tax=Faecousia sp. TaxID=2952921 RepID=UPI002A8C8787|nr:NADH-quinone oxidoreductase subunit NuoF [Candidatus Faecousia sp.]